MRRFKVLGISLLIAALAALAGAALYAMPLNKATFANRIADYRIHAESLSRPAAFGLPDAPSYERPDTSLSLITIDEESIGNAQAGLGQWPFPRAVYGKLLKRLAGAGAKTVVFDVVFLEPSSQPGQDAAFAGGARRVKTVIGYAVTTTSTGITGAEIPPPNLRDAMQIGYTTIDSPGGFVIGQSLQIAPIDQVPGHIANALALAGVQNYRGTRVDVRALPTLEGEVLTVPFHEIGTVDTTQRVGAQQTQHSVCRSDTLACRRIDHCARSTAHLCKRAHRRPWSDRAGIERLRTNDRRPVSGRLRACATDRSAA